MKIRTKIISMGMALVGITAATLVGVTLYQKEIVSHETQQQMNQQIRSEAKKIAQGTYLMCRAAQESVLQSVESSLNVARDVLHESWFRYSDRLTAEIRWKAMSVMPPV